MEKIRPLTGALLAVLLIAAPAAPLPVPEHLVYEVTWSGIKAGSALLEVAPQGEELRLTNTIRSTGIVAAFFKIDDRTESVITRAGKPKFFRENKREGSYRAAREATFNFTSLKANSVDLLKRIEKSDAITPRTYDNLSSIYFIRSSELTPGQSISFDIYDTQRLWNTEVRVVRRQELKTPRGTFKTVMVTSRLTHNGEAAKVGNATFWFTDDSRRVPVRISTTMKIGEVTLTLVEGG
ncbi:DUF3108 domain-containing protein [Geomonas sp. Red69]|uniref:DUF3108 domain-containing protein n=1 Tax=Geomonas diazotrophica TaxID=2843197 RepID=UPI001C110E21|nr:MULTISPECIES: DUF3108 domain-containing protein [Geomonas]MBU5638538.1 DUF3108 domain-containing protein [Geomonas diazotrophica]QXE86361.1 DUF3108 domain-containing protein [Geomonas nitrogeniifigens]